MQGSLNVLHCQFKDSPFFSQFLGAMPQSAGAGDPPDSANANLSHQDITSVRSEQVV